MIWESVPRTAGRLSASGGLAPQIRLTIFNFKLSIENKMYDESVSDDDDISSLTEFTGIRPKFFDN